MESILLPFILFLLVAILYSSVGHAGASGYLAIMGLLSFAPDSIKPTSLILNIVVALIASISFIRASYFDRKIFLTFIVTSIPFSFLGGYITLPPDYFKLFAGIFLVCSAIVLLIRNYIVSAESTEREMPLLPALIIGAVIGLLSGLIGVGGGIFLSPILILARWTSFKKASGIAALFILCNSISGLAGNLTAIKKIDEGIFFWIPAVVIGGIIGSWLGSKKYTSKWIIAILFVVLLTAGLKFILIDFTK